MGGYILQYPQNVVKRTVAGMLCHGVSRRQVVEETSALYGIPKECVEEVVAAVPA